MPANRSWESASTPYVLAILRILYGILWLQQAAWKVPPDFGMLSNGGLFSWTQQMAKYSFLPPHRFFVSSVVLPYFLVFAWLTLLTELFIGFSHLLGILSRLGALAALFMSANLLVGLARHPGEWPWSYIMLLGYALLFLSAHPGRVLGLDGWLSRRLNGPALTDRPWARALAFLT
ncbi:MAG: TQO small subunit DoxD [candidate division NC10 bacterium]|nr:TQO small subunit DoxD [candidate division NC10 bacterium]